MQLPFEVLAIVFTHLPPKDLDNVKLVCRGWCEVASDKVWKQRFAHQFGTTQITRIVSASTQWRREFLIRQAVLLKWRRCVKEFDITLNSTLSDVSNLFPNFTTDTPRTICFNTHTGMGNMWDLDRGKMRRRVYASKYSHQLLPIASIDGSRFGLVYGFYNGEVAAVSFTRDGTVVTDYSDLPYRHDSAITALWIAKLRQVTKTPKRPEDSAVVASGSTDGTVFLFRPELHRQFRVTDNCIVLLEGTMYGSFVKNDGSLIACLDLMGKLTLLDIMSEPRDLAQLPFTLETVQRGIELHMANDYVIVQTADAIYAVDIHTKFVNTLSPPPEHHISTFGIDKSYTPGTKYIAAGFSNNEISVWPLPSPPSASIIRMEKYSEVSEQESRPSRQPELSERELQTTPIWTAPNPIGYDHRLEASGKPQITQLALNAAVLLVAGYNGVVTAMDVLSGQSLKRVSSRISKNVLDLLLYSRDGFVPVTHLEIDPNPLHFRAIIVTRPAVQYLDLGPFDTKKAARKHVSRSKQRAGTPHVSSSASRQDLAEEISLRREFAELDAEREEEQRSLRETFSMDTLGEEEQLEYAMMLSEQAAANGEPGPASVMASDYGNEDNEDEQLRRAIELSASEGQNSAPAAELLENISTDAGQVFEQGFSADSASDEYDDSDEELRRAIELSTLEVQNATPEVEVDSTGASNSNSSSTTGASAGAGAGTGTGTGTGTGAVTGTSDTTDELDEDLRRALELSLEMQ